MTTDATFMPEPWMRHGEAEMTIVRLLDVEAAVELRVGGKGKVWAWRADAPPDLSRKGTAESVDAAKAAALRAAQSLHAELRTRPKTGD
jgi:hypothetical protein